MRVFHSVLGAVVLSLTAAVTSHAQQATAAAVPHVISVSGVFQPASGDAPPAGTVVTLAVYADPQGGAPLWQETQNVTLDKAGRFTVLLGATQPEGIPVDLFAAGDARWLGMHFAGLAETERPRTPITSVPYALRAADADTLGGRPASAYLLAPSAADSATQAGTTSGSGASSTKSLPPADVVLPGTTNFLAKYVNGADVGNSGVFENGGAVGIGTTTPLDFMHVRFTNTNGGFTGYAVQNLGNTATSYSGTLFYDQNGALGQFQGFNNVTHEYRINNIATNAGVPNGSINFMIGSTSRLFVGSNGGVGIGTTTAGPGLEVGNALTGALVGSIGASTFGNNPFGGTFVARKARGTQGAPTAVQNNDQIALFAGVGQATTHSGNLGNGMQINAAENFTDAAQGTAINFLTTRRGTNTPVIGMTLGHDGNLGLGTSGPNSALDIVRNGNDATVMATSYSGLSGVALFSPRGTSAAPSATLTSDTLGVVAFGGYGATHLNQPAAVVGAIAAENWTDTAQGSAMGFLTTPVGTLDPVLRVAVLPNGNVGIGTPEDVVGLPTATDRLQVFGDVRVGTTGLNGCVKNFAGTGLIGVCSSDRRLKKEITPFGPALDRLAGLQPVFFKWRAAEFPERHFGDGRAYGLIAQDVERVLPELVVTNEDGYKAVDYTELPLLTIQAVKELRERVAELERIIEQLRAATSTRQ